MRVPLYVHKLLSWKEIRYSPDAVNAVRAEVASLAELGTWDHKNVVERNDLIAWALKEKTKVVILFIKNPDAIISRMRSAGDLDS